MKSLQILQMFAICAQYAVLESKHIAMCFLPNINSLKMFYNLCDIVLSHVVLSTIHVIFSTIHVILVT